MNIFKLISHTSLNMPAHRIPAALRHHNPNLGLVSDHWGQGKPFCTEKKMGFCTFTRENVSYKETSLTEKKLQIHQINRCFKKNYPSVQDEKFWGMHEVTNWREHRGLQSEEMATQVTKIENILRIGKNKNWENTPEVAGRQRRLKMGIETWVIPQFSVWKRQTQQLGGRRKHKIN